MNDQPTTSLQKTSHTLIEHMLHPSEAGHIEREFYDMLEDLKQQGISLDLIDGMEALFKGWHEQMSGSNTQIETKSDGTVERVQVGSVDNPTQHLQHLIAKAIQQPHHHLEFLELLYTCGKLGLKLPTMGADKDQNQTLNQLYYLIRANKPLREQLANAPLQLPIINAPNPNATLLLHLAQLAVAYGLTQLLLLLWTWVLAHN